MCVCQVCFRSACAHVHMYLGATADRIVRLGDPACDAVPDHVIVHTRPATALAAPAIHACDLQRFTRCLLTLRSVAAGEVPKSHTRSCLKMNQGHTSLFTDHMRTGSRQARKGASAGSVVERPNARALGIPTQVPIVHCQPSWSFQIRHCSVCMCNVHLMYSCGRAAAPFLTPTARS